MTRAVTGDARFAWPLTSLLSAVVVVGTIPGTGAASAVTSGYHALYRLTRETISGGPLPAYEKQFGYDRVGNRLSQVTTGAGAASVAYAYDTRDRIQSENTLAYSFDVNGNLVGKDGVATYVWDFDNRLIEVHLASGALVEHQYDVDGTRVRTKLTPPTGPPTQTDFLVDTASALSHVVAETDGTGALQASYVRGDDLLSIHRPGQVRYVHADGLGSIRRLTDEIGTVTDRYTYTAFGELLEHIGSDPQPYQFAGEPYDPNSGFYYNRARWLDPRVGRFIAVDPHPASPYEPGSLHRYTYAHSEPITTVDPTGRTEYTLTGLVVSMGIGAVIGAIAGYSAMRSFRGAAEGALMGAVAGASFYAAAPLAAPLLWRISLVGTSAATAASTGTVTLYRAMSTAECQSVLSTGRFSASANSLGGKWFAESLPHAIQWGQKLEGGNFRVVQVDVREQAARFFLRLPMLDRIGPARYAELEQLNEAVVSVRAVYP